MSTIFPMKFYIRTQKNLPNCGKNCIRRRKKDWKDRDLAQFGDPTLYIRKWLSECFTGILGGMWYQLSSSTLRAKSFKYFFNSLKKFFTKNYDKLIFIFFKNHAWKNSKNYNSFVSVIENFGHIYVYYNFFYLCRKNFTVYLGHLLYAQLEQENILQVGSNHFDDD